MTPCHRCGVKYQQGHRLCRSCQRETGVDNRSIFERERDRIAKQQHELQQCQRVTYVPRVPATRVINGVEFEITWDGSR
jgi:hypothetical protein